MNKNEQNRRKLCKSNKEVKRTIRNHVKSMVRTMWNHVRAERKQLIVKQGITQKAEKLVK